MDIAFQIQRAIKTGKVYLGFRQSEKSLLNGRARLVIIASNARKDLKDRVEYLARLDDVPIYRFPGTSMELGSVCGRPHAVSVIVVEDPGDSSILEIVKEEKT